MTDQQMLIQFALGAVSFYSGCYLAYQSGLRDYGIKGCIAAYVLVLAGLVACAWSVLWTR